MKTLLFALLLLIEGECATPTTVYICDSPNARRYHYREDCRGLSGCTYRVIKTTLEKAKEDSKTLCKWEQSH